MERFRSGLCGFAKVERDAATTGVDEPSWFTRLRARDRGTGVEVDTEKQAKFIPNNDNLASSKVWRLSTSRRLATKGLTLRINQGKENTETSQNHKKHMSTLVVVGYDEPYKAEEIRLKLRKLQSEYLLDLEDAVVAVKDEKGKVKLHQSVNLTAAGAVSGGFWGSLIGLIFLNPLLGFAMGAAAGAASGALTDLGIDDNFMKELAASMTPGSSTLFVLVRKSTPDKVLEELKGTGGRVLKTSLSHEDEAKLQAALTGGKS